MSITRLRFGTVAELNAQTFSRNEPCIATDLGASGRLGIATDTGLGSDVLNFTDIETDTILSLDDTPASYSGAAGQVLKVNIGETAMEFAADTGVTEFTGLTDTPANYSGASGTSVKVNGTGTALEFVGDLFTGHTDTPSSYAGAALQGVRVNAGETALEFAASTSTPRQATAVVDAAGGGDYTTIQAAVTATASGLIYVRNGTYDEQVDMGAKTDLTLLAESKGVLWTLPATSTTAGDACLKASGIWDRVKIQGFTIDPSVNYASGTGLIGINAGGFAHTDISFDDLHIEQTNPTGGVLNLLRIDGTRINVNGGFYSKDGANGANLDLRFGGVGAEDVTISNAHFYMDGNNDIGIQVVGVLYHNVNIVGCTFQGNAGAGYGIQFGSGADYTSNVSGCTFRDCVNGILGAGDDVTVTGCSFEDCTIGLVMGTDEWCASGCVFHGGTTGLQTGAGTDYAAVSACSFISQTGDAINWDGSDGIVSGVTIRAPGGDGIDVSGVRNVFTGIVTVACGAYGIIETGGADVNMFGPNKSSSDTSGALLLVGTSSENFHTKVL
jgi:hypothetical protein